MAKRLIYQVYTGKRSKLYDHCTASVKAYAEDINSKDLQYQIISLDLFHKMKL